MLTKTILEPQDAFQVVFDNRLYPSAVETSPTSVLETDNVVQKLEELTGQMKSLPVLSFKVLKNFGGKKGKKTRILRLAAEGVENMVAAANSTQTDTVTSLHLYQDVDSCYQVSSTTMHIMYKFGHRYVYSHKPSCAPIVAAIRDRVFLSRQVPLLAAYVTSCFRSESARNSTDLSPNKPVDTSRLDSGGKKLRRPGSISGVAMAASDDSNKRSSFHKSLVLDQRSLAVVISSLPEMSFKVVKRFTRFRRAPRVLKLAPTCIKNVKKAGEASSEHPFSDVSAAYFKGDTLTIKYKSTHEYVYITAEAQHIADEINFRCSLVESLASSVPCDPFKYSGFGEGGLQANASDGGFHSQATEVPVKAAPKDQEPSGSSGESSDRSRAASLASQASNSSDSSHAPVITTAGGVTFKAEIGGWRRTKVTVRVTPANIFVSHKGAKVLFSHPMATVEAVSLNVDAGRVVIVLEDGARSTFHLSNPTPLYTQIHTVISRQNFGPPRPISVALGGAGTPHSGSRSPLHMSNRRHTFAPKPVAGGSVVAPVSGSLPRGISRHRRAPSTTILLPDRQSASTSPRTVGSFSVAGRVLSMSSFGGVSRGRVGSSDGEGSVLSGSNGGSGLETPHLLPFAECITPGSLRLTMFDRSRPMPASKNPPPEPECSFFGWDATAWVEGAVAAAVIDPTAEIDPKVLPTAERVTVRHTGGSMGGGDCLTFFPEHTLEKDHTVEPSRTVELSDVESVVAAGAHMVVLTLGSGKCIYLATISASGDFNSERAAILAGSASTVTRNPKAPLPLHFDSLGVSQEIARWSLAHASFYQEEEEQLSDGEGMGDGNSPSLTAVLSRRVRALTSVPHIPNSPLERMSSKHTRNRPMKGPDDRPSGLSTMLVAAESEDSTVVNEDPFITPQDTPGFGGDSSDDNDDGTPPPHVEAAVEACVMDVLFDSASNPYQATQRLYKTLGGWIKTPRSLLGNLLAFLESLGAFVEENHGGPGGDIEVACGRVVPECSPSRLSTILPSVLHHTLQVAVVAPVIHRLVPALTGAFQEEEAALERGVQALSAGAGSSLATLEVSTALQSSSNYAGASLHLGTLTLDMVPLDMIRVLLETVSLIYNQVVVDYDRLLEVLAVEAEAAKATGGKVKIPDPPALGADDLLPIFTFVFLKSRIPSPVVIRELMVGLCGRSRMHGQVEYYLTMFSSVLAFVAENDPNKKKKK